MSNYSVNPLNRISVEEKKPSAAHTHCSQRISRQTFTDCKLGQQSSHAIQALRSLHLFKGLPTPKDREHKNLIPRNLKLLPASSKRKTDYSFKNQQETLLFSFSKYSASCIHPSVHLYQPCCGWKAGCHTARSVWSFDCLRSSLLPLLGSTAYKQLLHFGANQQGELPRKDQVAEHKPVPAAPVDSLSPTKDQCIWQNRETSVLGTWTFIAEAETLERRT